MRRGALFLSLLALGCGAASSADAGADAGEAPELPATIGPSERPARFVAPAAHDGVTPLPAIVLLHGYSVDGASQDLYLGFSRATAREGFYAVIPDGTASSAGARFWNATPACCNFEASEVDDVVYLTGLIDELEALVPISAVYLFGHSNGGFMSYRLACERPERVDAIVSLAGSDFAGDGDCVPARPVSVLQIHGDLDATILYGGTSGYPAAPRVVERWAARAGCEATSTEGAPLDLEPSLAGAETTVESYGTGCDGGSAELWTIVGGGHIPTTSRDFMPAVFAWMRAHAR